MFELVAAEKANYPIAVMCRFLGVSSSDFYAWQGRLPSARTQANVALCSEVRAIHAEARATYGSPRIHRELRRRGSRVSRKRVASLMRREGIYGRKRRRFRTTTDSNHDDPIAPNLLNRDFTSEQPGAVMVGDTTAIETKEGWLFLAVLLDLCTRAIVGWAMSEHNDTALVLRAFRMGVKRNFRTGFIHHTDRGSTYASKDYREAVESRGGVRSMSRRADCYDNAVGESVFRTIKEEGIGEDVPETIAEAKRRVFSFIEGFYNTKRLHSTLGYVTPKEFEDMKLSERARNQLVT